jgi:ssDNA-binding Zn-finger/Zn-ribbon topoisomerase 1
MLHIPTHFQGMTLPPDQRVKRHKPEKKRCPECEGELREEDVEGEQMLSCSNPTCNYTEVM